MRFSWLVYDCSCTLFESFFFILQFFFLHLNSNCSIWFFRKIGNLRFVHWVLSLQQGHLISVDRTFGFAALTIFPPAYPDILPTHISQKIFEQWLHILPGSLTTPRQMQHIESSIKSFWVASFTITISLSIVISSNFLKK